MKKLLKFLQKLFANFWFRLTVLLVVIVAIFALSGAFSSPQNMGQHILEIVTSGDVLSIFLVAAVSLIVATIVIKVSGKLEETYKTEDDHHKIVCQYFKHARPAMEGDRPKPVTENLYRPNGIFMCLVQVPEKRNGHISNPAKKHTEEYRRRNQDILAYRKGLLFLPSINIFANVCGTAVTIADENVRREPPRFVRENSLALMEAHKGSSYQNSVTIRLNDAAYENGVFTLHTGRSQYFDMLITNRCMDFRLHNIASVRQVYESGSTVSPLSVTQMGNQIGINGLIFTCDGYLLVEKRGYTKSTWKNKFAQPISLALKRDSVALREDGTIDPNGAQAVFKSIVMGTLGKNFGLTEDDVKPFDITKNFFGLERDLLEGGKPNLYFYVTVKMTAAELDVFLEEKYRTASRRMHEMERMDYEQMQAANEREKREAGGKEVCYPDISAQKLDSDYYLIKYDDIHINYNYELKLKAKDMIRVNREFYPRVSKATQRTDGGIFRLKQRTGGHIKRECGEALLVCLYYAEMCHERLVEEQREIAQTR